MASVDVQKMTSGKRGAMIKHMDRTCENHSNKDINPELSHLNYPIGCESYRDAVEKSKERVKEVDKVLPPKRIRKDRVVSLALEVPCPCELTEAGKSDLFFEKAYETLQELLGAENVHGGIVHKDEVHEYYDKRSKGHKTSLEHAHVLATPFVPEVGVNGKQCVTRGFFNELNRKMEEMCNREFGIEYMTHEAPQKLSVEALKAQGRIDELEHQIEELQEQNKALLKQNTKLVNWKMEHEAIVDDGKRLFGHKDTATIRSAPYDEVQGMKNQVSAMLDTAKELSNNDVKLLAMREALTEKGASLEVKERVLQERESNFEAELKEKATEIAKEIVKNLPENRTKHLEIAKDLMKQVQLRNGERLIDVFDREVKKYMEETLKQLERSNRTVSRGFDIGGR